MVLMTKVIDSHIVSNFNACVIMPYDFWSWDTWHSQVFLAILASSFPMLGRHTLIFINVVSLHLTLVGDSKGKKSSFILHSFCIHTLSFFYKENPPLSTKWLALRLRVPTPPEVVQTLLVVAQILPMSTMHPQPFQIPFSLLLSSFLSSPSFLKFSFPNPRKSNYGKVVKKRKKNRTQKNFDWRLERMLRMRPTTPSWGMFQGVEKGVGVLKLTLIRMWWPLIFPAVLTLT